MSLITVYEDVLKPALVADYFEVLIGDCKAAFDIKSLNTGSSSNSSSNVNSDSYSVGSTYFIRANETPVCNLERLVKEIYSFHTAGIECDTSSSGAEWWTQVIDSRDDIGFHWDRDYELEESEGVHVYPIKSTVTYLSDCGAPTMIVDKRGTADSSYELIGAADKFSLCKPKVGRSIVFDGSLLHAAPSGINDENDDDKSQSDSDDDDDEEEKEDEEDDDVERRVTLLVNVWIDHIPHQAKRFEQLSPAALTATIPEDLLHLCWKRLVGQEDDQSCSDLELLCSSSSCSRMKRWKFNNTGTNYTIEVPLPPVNQLTDRLMERGSLTVGYGVEDSTSINDETDEHKGSLNDCKIRIAYSKHQPVDHSEDEDEEDDDEHDEDDHDVDADEEDGDEDVAVIEESKPKRTRY